MTVRFTRPAEFLDELRRAAQRPEGVVDSALRLTTTSSPAGSVEFVATFATRTLFLGAWVVETVRELRCGWDERDGAPADREAARVWWGLREGARALGLDVAGGAFAEAAAATQAPASGPK